MTRAWSGTFGVTQSWSGTFDVKQNWAGTFDVTQAWSGTVDVFIEAASFVGAYDDIDNIAAIWSLARRTLTSYEGNLVRLREDGDNTEQDFGADGDGNLDTAAISTFLGANNGYIVTLYDQSGNGNDATQATAASQPLYVASGQNSRPVMRFDGTDDTLACSVAIMQGQFSVLVGYRSSTGFGGILESLDVSVQTARIVVYSDMRSSPRRHAAYAPDGSFRAIDNDVQLSVDTHYLSTTIADASTMYGWRDGVSQGTVDISAATGQGNLDTLDIGRQRAGNLFHEGDISEIVIADAAWSTGERGDAEQIAASYWGITLS